LHDDLALTAKAIQQLLGNGENCNHIFSQILSTIGHQGKHVRTFRQSEHIDHKTMYYHIQSPSDMFTQEREKCDLYQCPMEDQQYQIACSTQCQAQK
jgi:hypothetical protein